MSLNVRTSHPFRLNVRAGSTRRAALAPCYAATGRAGMLWR